MQTLQPVSVVLLLILALAPARLARSQSTQPATASVAGSPGVKLTIHRLDHPDVAIDVRVARLIALALPSGADPTRATFDGFINLKIRGDYTFTAHGAGTCELIVNGQSVLSVAGDDLSTKRSERVRLKKGANAITVRFESPAKGEAQLRLYWAERDNPAEPIPPTVLTHDAADIELGRHLTMRAGRELVAQLHCAKCHLLDSGLPEAAADAPSLVNVGARLRGEWMARWIADPLAVRHDASMPRVFPTDDPRVHDVAAYLTSLKDAPPPPQEQEFLVADAARGGRLFVDLGCVACHSFEPGKRTPLAHARQKFYAPALVAYLRDPFRHYPWNPMPDFRLKEDEARQLAAYIWSRGAAEQQRDRRGDPQRGKMLFETSGCANCHTVGNEKRETARTAVNGRAGCLSDAENRGNAPLFELSDPQRRALAAAIESTHSTRAHDTPADFAERQVRSLNCVACHTLDVLPDTWSSLKSEIEAVQGTAARDDLVGDQSRPSLTWAGERLRGDWMSRFIAGQVEEKPRPWLAARMPSFGALRGKLLAEGLAQQHGILAPGEPESPVDNELARVGQRLAGKEEGFSCVTCHAVGTASAISPFEAYGPNFAQTARRMRHDFYTRWVRNPQRYEPGTRMPQYADLEGKTSFRDVFEGDAVKQFEAIWQYLRTGEKIEPPR